MHPHRFALGLLAAVSFVLPLAAGAALLDRGNGLIYDTDRDITWLSDADLLNTRFIADPLIYAEIIATVKTVDDGRTTHVLTLDDFSNPASSRHGLATWYGATAWAEYLTFDGYDDWRLPTSLQPDPACSQQIPIRSNDTVISRGSNCSGSELGHLFYDELGGQAGTSLLAADGHNANLGLFTNVKADDYWTGTPLLTPGSSTAALYFGTEDGSQSFLGITSENIPYLYSWLVRDGDIAAVPTPPGTVPEPGVGSLLFLGAGAVAVFRRGKRGG